jgi:hypothetical protein
MAALVTSHCGRNGMAFPARTWRVKEKGLGLAGCGFFASNAGGAKVLIDALCLRR